VIEPEGWVLTNFRKNPIALFGHSSSFPIGKWSNVRVEGNKLLARLNLAAKGTSARIDELINLVEQGILRAVSVGFLPIESEPIDPKKPYEGVHYTKQELLETSLVSVPANPAALVLAKSLHISDETISLAFGVPAGTRQRNLSNGVLAATSLAKKAPPKMQTLSQRIEHAQNELVAKRDRLTELNGAEDLDIDAISGLTDEITVAERAVAVLKASEAKIGINAGPADLSTPAIVRRPLSIGQKEVDGFDLLVRSITARGIAHFSNKSIDQVLQERYPGHEATAIVTKADQTIGTTTVSGWASQLVQTVNQGFLQALLPYSIYPALRARGIGFSFDGIGTVSLPSRTAGGAGGGFVAEGSPIRVGRITTAAVTLTPFKLGVIVPFSRELAKRSTPAIEALVRQAILEDTAAILGCRNH
jgi:HK97 family phage prohead protease